MMSTVVSVVVVVVVEHEGDGSGPQAPLMIELFQIFHRDKGRWVNLSEETETMRKKDHVLLADSLSHINHVYGSSAPQSERLHLCSKRLARTRLHLFSRIKRSLLRPSSHGGVKSVLKTFRSVPEVRNVHLNLERFCNGACGPERAESFRNSQGANSLKYYTCGTLPTTAHTLSFLSFILLFWSGSLEHWRLWRWDVPEAPVSVQCRTWFTQRCLFIWTIWFMEYFSVFFLLYLLLILV